MKTIKINLLIFALLGIISTAFSQSVKHGYLRHSGQMYEIKNGKTYALNNDVKLNNGSTVLRNGTVINQNGTRRNMSDGEAVDVLGQILYPQTEQNGDVILVPRRDDQYERRRDNDRYERNDSHEDGRYSDRKDKYKKNKKSKGGPPYGNAYGYYKNKDKKNK